MNHIIKCTNCGATYIAGQAGNCPYCVVIVCNKNIAEFVTENTILREALEWFADLKHDTLIVDINRRARKALQRAGGGE